MRIKKTETLCKSGCYEYTRLLISVESRVVMDDCFATGELCIVLSRQNLPIMFLLRPQEGRVIKAFNDKPAAD